VVAQKKRRGDRKVGIPIFERKKRGKKVWGGNGGGKRKKAFPGHRGEGEKKKERETDRGARLGKRGGGRGRGGGEWSGTYLTIAKEEVQKNKKRDQKVASMGEGGEWGGKKRVLPANTGPAYTKYKWGGAYPKKGPECRPKKARGNNWRFLTRKGGTPDDKRGVKSPTLGDKGDKGRGLQFSTEFGGRGG